LHIPQLMPDEFVLGYWGRVARANGYTETTGASRSHLLAWYKQETGDLETSAFTTQLAYATGVRGEYFAQGHTLIPFLRAVMTSKYDHAHGDPKYNGTLVFNGTRLIREDIQFCEQCVKEDLEYRGYSYWRRSHQLIGIDWCLKHNNALFSSRLHNGFSQDPDRLLKSQHVSINEIGREVEDNIYIQRYSDLTQIVADLPTPVPPKVISPLLAKLARKTGLRYDELGEGPTVSHITVERIPHAWLNKHFKILVDKNPNTILREFDGVCRAVGQAHKSMHYILATAVLSDSIQGARLLIEKAHQSRLRDKVQKATDPYLSHRIITAKESDHSLISADCSKQTLNAIFDFYKERSELKNIISRHIMPTV